MTAKRYIDGFPQQALSKVATAQIELLQNLVQQSLLKTQILLKKIEQSFQF
jgi:hypothetical protein